ncbi:MAG: hypothetical protein CME21_02325 [Gemmatimonadetes bacterium]|nr:hypothetical protein [Gemmatimonadota bacterium]
MLNCAWVCDDAFITFRSIDNFLGGFGLRWNVAERVQTFTHPLWLLLLVPVVLVFGDPYFAVLVQSITISAAAAWFSMRFFSADWQQAVVIAILLCVSKAFVDFSTSGLENPLIHALFACFIYGYMLCHGRNRTAYLCWIAGLSALTRLDSLVLLSPALLVTLIQEGRRSSVRKVLIGFVPLITWIVFSTLYYGFPLPNTYYAKITTGVSFGTRYDLALDYFTHSGTIDPITLLTICVGVLVSLSKPDVRPFGIGILLHVVYLLWAGGDFMSGRLLTGSYFASVILIVARVGSRRRLLAGVATAAIVLAVLTPRSPVWARWDETYELGEPSGVVDERAYYFNETGLIKTLIDPGVRERLKSEGLRLREKQPVVAARYAIGRVGYYAGPDVHIIDRNALADPLLARMPTSSGVILRPGHYTRSMPGGYVETIWKDQNRLRSESISGYYEVIRRLTRGDLTDGGRLADIILFNLGLSDLSIPSGVRVESYPVDEAIAALGPIPEEGFSGDTTGTGKLALLAESFLDRQQPGYAAAAWGTAQHLGAQSAAFWRLGGRL